MPYSLFRKETFLFPLGNTSSYHAVCSARKHFLFPLGNNSSYHAVCSARKHFLFPLGNNSTYHTVCSARKHFLFPLGNTPSYHAVCSARKHFLFRLGNNSTYHTVCSPRRHFYSPPPHTPTPPPPPREIFDIPCSLFPEEIIRKSRTLFSKSNKQIWKLSSAKFVHGLLKSKVIYIPLRDFCYDLYKFIAMLRGLCGI